MGVRFSLKALASLAAVSLGLIACRDDFVHEPGPWPGIECEPWAGLEPGRKWIERLVKGHHESRLSWRGLRDMELTEEQQIQDVAFEIAKTSAWYRGGSCDEFGNFDAKLEIALDDERRAMFTGSIRGTKDGAELMMSGKTAPGVTLANPGLMLPSQSESEYELHAWIDESEIRGDLESTNTYRCQRASWPADRVCELSERQVPSDTVFGDFEFDQVMSELEQIGPMPLEWKDDFGGSPKTTTVELTFERGEAPICVGTDNGEDINPDLRGRGLMTTVSTRVKTEDGRVDAKIPVEIFVRWSKKHGRLLVDDGFVDTLDYDVMLDGNVDRAGETLFQPRYATEGSAGADDFQSIQIQASVGPSGVKGYLQLSKKTVPNAIWLGDHVVSESSREGVCLEETPFENYVREAKFGVQLEALGP